MKKWLCLLLAGVLTFSLAACRREQNPDTLPTESNGTEQTESTGATQPDNTEVTPNTAAEIYTNFLNNYTDNTGLFYFIKDIDNNETEELIITQNTELEVYTYEDSVKKVGTHDFITGTLLLHYTNDKKYPGIVYVTVGGGKRHFGYITVTDGALTVQQTFDEMISGGKESVYYTQDAYLIALSRKVYKEFYRIGYSVWEAKTAEDLYAIREITDDRVKIANNKKSYDDDSFFSLTIPADWKCLEQQGEDGRSHFFRDPELGENCQLSLSLTGAEFLYERTPEQYQEFLSRSRQNLVIDSIAKETIQGYQCTKVVYSYTKNDTKFIKTWYNNLIVGRRLYNFSIIYPADQKDTYEPVFAAMMDSVLFYQTK